MKRLDSSEKSILEIRWSSDGVWLSYVAGDEVRLANVETGETRIIAEGNAPLVTRDQQVIFEQNDEIRVAHAKGVRTLFSKSDLVKDSPKREPSLSPDGERLLFLACNIFDKKSQSLNAYPYRHFLATATPAGGRPRLLEEQWYGGYVSWFPDSQRFTHFEFDSTAGPRIHIVRADTGKKEGALSGLYPSISPDGASLAARPRGGGSVVIYTSKGDWGDDAAIGTSVIKLPIDELSRPSATPPQWLDNRLLLIPEASAVFRVDIKREKAEPVKLPLPTFRRSPSMVISPDRELIAMEIQVDGGYELGVGKPG